MSFPLKHRLQRSTGKWRMTKSDGHEFANSTSRICSVVEVRDAGGNLRRDNGGWRTRLVRESTNPLPTFRQSSNIDSVEIAGGLELVIVGGVNWHATRETYRLPTSYDSIWRGMQLRRGDDNQKVRPRPGCPRHSTPRRCTNCSELQRTTPDARVRAGANALSSPLLIIYSTVVNQSGRW